MKFHYITNSANSRRHECTICLTKYSKLASIFGGFEMHSNRTLERKLHNPSINRWGNLALVENVTYLKSGTLQVKLS